MSSALRPVVDDKYLISMAKTEYREAHNSGDLDRLLAVFSDEFTDWSEGEPSFYGTEARAALRLRMKRLFQDFDVQMAVIIIDIAVQGNTATDYGWHKVTLKPKGGNGEVLYTKYRYYETWQKDAKGSWKINFIMTNREHPPRMLPEE
jgi:ketosteroid isomerase-like protein